MEQSPPCGCLAVVFTVLQEAVLVLAVNPMTERIATAWHEEGEGGWSIITFWSENDTVTLAASSVSFFF